MVLTWGPTWGLVVVAGILQVAVMNLLWRMLWARCAAASGLFTLGGRGCRTAS